MKTAKNTSKTGNGRQRLLLSDQYGFSIQEAFKSLRTNVMFSLPGSGCKCIGITSPTPGDGKSTTAANLAISLGQIGKRVLLVDGDMRLPTVATAFRISGTPGLSDFLVGQAKVEEVVRPLENQPLSVLPAGNIPPDPTGLLEAKQLEHLFNAFRKIYDYVVVDLPPVTSVPDAQILSRFLDGYLLVIRQKRTKHRDIQAMLKQLKLADAKILGFCTVGDVLPGSRYEYYGKKKRD